MTDINAIKVSPNLNLRLGDSKKRRSIGILNKGKRNKFINNKFFGLDIGIQDEGEDSLAIGNESSR